MAVTVRPKGILEDVRAVSISRDARETGKSESEVRAALEGPGYRVMMPSDFLRFLADLKGKGSAAKPLSPLCKRDSASNL